MKISFDALMSMLTKAVSAKFGQNCWLREVFEDRVIIGDNSDDDGMHCYEVPYTLSEDEKSVVMGDRGQEVKQAFVPLAEMNDVPILTVGKHTGDGGTLDLSEKDLDTIVANFNSMKRTFRPPLTLGHSEGQVLLKEVLGLDKVPRGADKGDYPAAGWVDSMKRKGTVLYADFKKVPDRIKKLVEDGSYGPVSAEVYKNLKVGGKAVGHAMRRVALLGQQPPAVKDAGGALAMFAEDNGQDTAWVMFSEQGPEKPEKEETSMTEEEKKKMQEMEAENARLRSEKEASDVKLAEQEKTSRRERISAKVDGLVKEGKLAPALKDNFVALMEMAEDAGMVKLGDKEEKGVTVMDAIVAGLGTAVKLGEQVKAGKKDDEHVSLSEAQKEVNRQLGVNDDTFVKFADKEKEA